MYKRGSGIDVSGGKCGGSEHFNRTTASRNYRLQHRDLHCAPSCQCMYCSAAGRGGGSRVAEIWKRDCARVGSDKLSPMIIDN